MCTIQRELKRILAMEKHDVPLRELAKSLGCSLSSSYTSDGKHLEDEMVRRIQEAARSRRESSLWIIAVISAVASVVSALAAWFAIIGTK